MPTKTLESREARENWRDTLDTATRGDADVIITRYGKPVTAMIRYEDYVNLRTELQALRRQRVEAYQAMLASEEVLRRAWDTPEEDAAWADL
jgi:prevent-host-death family protein